MGFRGASDRAARPLLRPRRMHPNAGRLAYATTRDRKWRLAAPSGQRTRVAGIRCLLYRSSGLSESRRRGFRLLGELSRIKPQRGGTRRLSPRLTLNRPEEVKARVFLVVVVSTRVSFKVLANHLTLFRPKTSVVLRRQNKVLVFAE